MITRYDKALDVIHKALRGTGVSLLEISAKIHSSPEILANFLAGNTSNLDLISLGNTLGLNGSALAKLDNTPIGAASLPPEIVRLEMPFDDETVNAWWLKKGEQTLLIDTGADPADLKNALAGKRVDTVLITHPHGDHIGGLSLFSGSQVCYGEAIALRPLPWGEGMITAMPLPGHHAAAWGFYYQRSIDSASDHSWFATGDALFAGSMGGCVDPESFAKACESLGRALAILPPDCLILPGHGAASTVAIEQLQNPFAPMWGNI